jgi:deoxyribodipyrimidine photo-lyase
MNELLTYLLRDRVAALNDEPVRDKQDFVLLWLHGQRRIVNNLAFAHAQRLANELRKPLVVYEALRRDHPFASERFHRFVLEGIESNARDCEKQGVAYGFFLDTPEAPRGVLHALSARAAVVVMDYLPHFIHPKQSKALAARAVCRVEAVDAAGVAPLKMFPKAEIAARTLRPKLMRALPDLLQPIPRVPSKLDPLQRFDWGFTPFTGTPSSGIELAQVSREVKAAEGAEGGRAAGLKRLQTFVQHALKGYAEGRNEPSANATSGMSAYLHFGHLGAAEIALAAQGSEAPRADVEAFVEELLVRRELSYNFVSRSPRHGSLEAIPPWARATLAKHRKDPRPALPSDAELEEARSPDPLWNALQNQLLREGRIHGWLRMLWGKTLILWSQDAEQAYRRMSYLNDKYALDGRDAVSATNFLWCFGVHDRPFPERPVFGTVRSMSLSLAPKKHDLVEYLRRYGNPGLVPGT